MRNRKTTSESKERHDDNGAQETTSVSNHTSRVQLVANEPRSSCRCILSILKYVVVAMIVPPFLNYAALMQESQQLQNFGVQYDIGLGQKLYLRCNGTGVPTVIFDAPTGRSSDVWTVIFTETTKLTKACLYDRAGIGFSDRPLQNWSADANVEVQIQNRWKPSTVERMSDDLHRLITFSSQQPRPLIFVSAEIGSLVARFFTQIYESDVSELILIDPLSEDLFLSDNDVWAHYWWQKLLPSLQAMQLSAAIGLSRLALIVGAASQPVPIHQVDEAYMGSNNWWTDVEQRQKHLMCNPRHLSSAVDEHYFINETFSQMQTLFRMKQFPSTVSVTVISSEQFNNQLSSNLNKAWKETQNTMVTRLHPGAKHLTVDGVDSNTIYWRKPDVIISEIKRAVRRGRGRLPQTR